MAQVGFQFQGDVFRGGSLVFAAAGRLMKELSDGGIDVYALSALVYLGQYIPISQRQEAIVATSMEKRSRTRSGWLAKALNIGWGHNDAAFEISRTRGGCAVLLIINAFAAGSNALTAAQGLQELMRLNGCQDDLLPATDALRNVVCSLSPIMEDCGFQSVLENVNIASLAELGRLLSGEDFQLEHTSLMEDSGTPEETADAVHQLYLTATTGETIYLHAQARAAWLAAFAVHVLEMECAVMYHDHILWQAAGYNGSVSIQIGFEAPKTQEAFSRCFSLDPQHEAMQVIQYMESTYLLKEALAMELTKIPHLTHPCKQSIKTGIVQLITFLSTRKIFTDHRMEPNCHVVGITGPFRSISGQIVQVCDTLGLDILDLHDEVSRTLENANRGFFMRPPRGHEVDILTEDDKAEIQGICYCDDHSTIDENYGHSCYLEVISNIIAGFATTGLALLPCYFETVDVRVSASVISASSHKSKWLDTCIKSLTDPSARVNLPMLLNHLRRVFHGEDATELSKFAIAASGRGVTIAVRALLDGEAFSDTGQYIGIYSGRLDHGGCARDVVEESGRWVGGGQSHNLLMPATLAPGIRFVPPDSEMFSTLDVLCQVKTKPAHFEIHCDLVSTNASRKRRAIQDEETVPDNSEDSLLESQGRRVFFSIKLHDSIFMLLTADVSRSCSHDPASAFVIPRDDVFKTVETGLLCANPSDSSCALISSHGNRSRQLLSLCAVQGAFCSFVSNEKRCYLVLQEKACLACAFELARRKFQQNSWAYAAAAVICNGRSSKERDARYTLQPVRRIKRGRDIIGTFPLDNWEAFRKSTR